MEGFGPKNFKSLDSSEVLWQASTFEERSLLKHLWSSCFRKYFASKNVQLALSYCFIFIFVLLTLTWNVFPLGFRGREGEWKGREWRGERERNMHVRERYQLVVTEMSGGLNLQPGYVPSTGNQTQDPSVCGPTLWPPIHTSQCCLWVYCFVIIRAWPLTTEISPVFLCSVCALILSTFYMRYRINTLEEQLGSLTSIMDTHHAE